MSTFAVRVLRVDEVKEHTNADSLELAHVLGWQVVVKKGWLKAGDLAVYFPLDAILPPALKAECGLPEDHKRIKTIKLRGELSQGMLMPAKPHHKEDDDVTEELGVTKWEPPVAHIPANMRGATRKSNARHDAHFIKYNGPENFKNHPKVLEEGEEVVITEKIHGSNFRAMRLEGPNTFLEKIKVWFNKRRGKHTFADEMYVGSHNVNLYYREGNAYWDAAIALDLHGKLKDYPNHIVFAEVYGSTQKGFTYGQEPGKNTIRVFDVFANGKYMDHDDLVAFCTKLDLPMVPILYRGPWSEEVRKQYVDGKTTLQEKNPHIREGIVVRPVVERHERRIGRVLIKCISDAYLIAQGKKKDEDATEFH